MSMFSGRMHDVILYTIKSFPWDTYGDITVDPNADTARWPEDLTQAILNLLQADMTQDNPGEEALN